MNALYRADIIGNWFIAWSFEELGYSVRKTKLLKLVAYAQAQHIRIFGVPLFEDRRIEAWQYGPVVVNLLGITKNTDILYLDSSFSWDDIDEDTASFLVSVWNTYGGMTTDEIVELSHYEDFWSETFYSDNKEIPIDFLKELYASNDEKKLANA